MIKDTSTQVFLDALNLSHKNNDDYLGWCTGYFANVVELSKDVKIAFAKDGIGMKVKLYQLLNKYHLIGYDCVAACVNDLLCVGAVPVAIMDYIHMSHEDHEILYQIGVGFKNAAMDSKLNILGGEVSVYGDLKKQSIDVCGTAIGKLAFKTPIMGHDIRQGNIIIGLHSSGIHCNGTTDAIKNMEKGDTTTINPLLNMTYVDALTVPTVNYAIPMTTLFEAGIKPTGIVHVSGGGLKNLLRLQSQGVSFHLKSFPKVPDLFKVLRDKTGMSIDQMMNTFNMGVGMYLIIQQDEFNQTVKILNRLSVPYSIMGEVMASDDKRVRCHVNPLDL